MPICISVLIKCYLAPIQCVHCGIMIFPKKTLVRHRLISELQVVHSWKCVNCEVQNKFGSVRFKVPYEGFPYGILLLLLRKFKKLTLFVEWSLKYVSLNDSLSFCILIFLFEFLSACISCCISILILFDLLWLQCMWFIFYILMYTAISPFIHQQV